MKTIIKKSMALLAVGILFSFNISAKVDGTPKTLVVADANVVFTVNEIGNVNLVVVNTTNEKLKKSIETQFTKLKLSNLKANNAYSVVFNFKTI
jgi:hypothetical protein